MAKFGTYLCGAEAVYQCHTNGKEKEITVTVPCFVELLSKEKETFATIPCFIELPVCSFTDCQILHQSDQVLY